MSQEAVLYYFNGRGRAEIVRMVLCAAKMKFREVNLSEREEMLKLIDGGELLYNSLPLLKVDGFNIVQTNAIIRYIAHNAGLDGKDTAEKLWVGMYFEGTRDLYMPFLGILLRGTVEDIKGAVEASMPKYLPVFSKALEKSTSGYLVGSDLTLADLGLMEALLAIADYFGSDKLADYPLLMEYYKRMCRIGCIEDYIKNIRKRPNDEKYVTDVKKVLGRLHGENDC